ncbi:hypothetical protein ABT010_28710 [Streptomyces sp. NPDC002668]|uniref:hypothetical protein n=1 Tax=Streptomyces sp. NPDC002668 TaxID=3154422 RepID=UPI00332A0A62
MDERAVGAAALKLLRRRRGLSLADTARALLAIADEAGQPRTALPTVAGLQRSVARWESATPSTPDERYQLLLAHMYARTPAGQLALGGGSDFAELLDALAHLGESERQLAELRTLLLRTATEQGGGMLALLSPAAQSGIAAAVADPSRVDDELVAALAAVVSDVNAQVGSLPFVRLQLMLAPAVEVCRRLLGGPVPEPVLPTLRGTAVAARTLAGRLAFESRDECRIPRPVRRGDARGWSARGSVAAGRGAHVARARHVVLDAGSRGCATAGRCCGAGCEDGRQRDRASSGACAAG